MAAVMAAAMRAVQTLAFGKVTDVTGASLVFVHRTAAVLTTETGGVR